MGHYRIVRWRVNDLCSNTLRYVALRAIELTGASARRLLVATTFGGMGHYRIVRWRVNDLCSNTLRYVALRAIELTGASAGPLIVSY